MAPRPYYLSPRNGIYYVQMRSPITGKVLPARSTGEKTLTKAHLVAAEWYKSGSAPSNRRGTPAPDLSTLFGFDALSESLRTAPISPDQARRLVAILEARGLLTEKKSSADRPLVAFLAEFYDFEKSPFVKEKHSVGQRIGKTHCIDMGNRVERSWKPFFGEKKRLGDVTRADLKAFGQALASQGLAAASINKTLMVGKTALGWCHREGVLSTNPADGLPQYKGEAKKRGVLSGEEFQKLLEATWEDERAAVGTLVSATAGLRLGEVLALTLNDVLDDRILVRGSWSNVERVVKCPKNGSTRQAALLPSVRKALLSLAAQNPHKEGPRFIFWSTKHSNRPTDQKTITKGFYRALDVIGIKEAHRLARNVCFHSNRHFHAAQLADLVDLRTVALSTGHSSTALASHYAAHSTESQFQAVVTAAKKAFSSKRQKKTAQTPNRPGSPEAQTGTLDQSVSDETPSGKKKNK